MPKAIPVALSLSLVLSSAPARALDTAELVERHVAARGGRDRIARLGSVLLEGRYLEGTSADVAYRWTRANGSARAERARRRPGSPVPARRPGRGGGTGGGRGGEGAGLTLRPTQGRETWTAPPGRTGIGPARSRAGAPRAAGR